MAETVKPRITGLNGFRFLAALAVMVGHFGTIFCINYTSEVPSGLAVSFFFVLSGFILTYVSLGSMKLDRPTLIQFYIRRIARIWPIHVILLIGLLFLNFEFQLGRFLTNLFLLQSWIPIDSWVFSYNGVTWSISTEIFFSFMLPLFVIGGARQFWRKFCCLIVGVIIAIYTIQSLHLSGYFPKDVNLLRLIHANPVIRLPEFCSGVGLGFLYVKHHQKSTPRDRNRDSIAEILVLIPIFAIYPFWTTLVYQLSQSPWGGPGPAMWLSFSGMFPLFVLMIAVFSKTNGIISRLLEWKPISLLGDASYSLFMAHLPIYYFCSDWAWWASDFDYWQLGFLFMALCSAGSILIYGLIEQPIRLGIVKMSSQDWRAGSQTTFRHFQKALVSKSVAYSLIVVITLAILFKASIPNAIEYPKIQNIILATTKKQRFISFDNKFLLLGSQAYSSKKGVVIELAWRNFRGPGEYQRLVQIVDAQGQIITQTLYDDCQLSTSKKRRFV
ncbi:MAG: acyltransferase, partial [Planctomycetota bacterium]